MTFFGYVDAKTEDPPEKENRVGYTQWAELSEGSGYTPVGKTRGSIDPGYYDISTANGAYIFSPVRARTDDLIRFPDSVSKEVVDQIGDFWDREKMFRKYDLPFKRGILLYGPPGSGKTCTLQLISRDIVQRGGCVLNYNPQCFVGAYRAFRDIQPDTPIVVLMEDFDTVLKSSNESKLLNLLDGVEALDKVVFLATTNYPEKLEARVINRPSRFDFCVRVNHPDARAREIYLDSLAEDDDRQTLDISQYVKDTDKMSLAHVKELFIATVVLGCDYDVTVKRLKAMHDKQSSLDDIHDPKASGGFMGAML